VRPALCFQLLGEYATALSPAAASASQSSFIVSPLPRANSFSSTTGLVVNPTINPTRPPITKAIDVWALGVTLYCFVYGRCPFIADTEFELFNIIPRKQATFPSEVPGRDYVDSGLKDLLSRLLEKDVFKRITLKEIKVYEPITNVIEGIHILQIVDVVIDLLII
jgi:serine/threonine protein kinase